MARHKEVEIKFLVPDVKALEQALAASGFTQQTPPTHEHNTLYDQPNGLLRRRREVLRLRKYGDQWRLTHKSRGVATRYKTRTEHETIVGNGERMQSILEALGYHPAFVYEKFRSEWSDGTGEVVIDQTPIGDVAEIEGSPRWIDQTARKLGVPLADYITDSYAVLFLAWKQRTNSPAQNMTFRECGTKRPRVRK